MCNKVLNKEYKKLISFLNKNNFNYKRVYDVLFYSNDIFIIQITEDDVSIETLYDSRRYIFINESPDFLIELLQYLFMNK